MGCVRLLLAFLCPPLAVAMARGITNAFWLNLILTFCFGVPGVVHALWLLYTRED
jgi:uncharacterized membrane protein YqaE (UPF0057 family)